VIAGYGRAVATLAAIILLLIGGSGPLVDTVSANLAAESSSAPCLTTVRSSWDWLNMSAAIVAALASHPINDISHTFISMMYYSTFEVGHFASSAPECEGYSFSINVVFDAYNSSGFMGYYVVTENPATYSYLGTSFQSVAKGVGHNNLCSSSPCDNTIWAGHEVYANSGGTATLTESDFTFTQPAPSYPPTGCADYQTCVMSIWAGLTHDQGGGKTTFTGLVQAGTDAYCYGSSPSQTSYDAFYEIDTSVSSTGVICSSSNGGNVDLSAGDSVYTEVNSEAEYGQSNTLYDFYIYDSTSNTSCFSGANSDTQLASPHYASFIVENAVLCGPIDCASLPEFNTVTFTNAHLHVEQNSEYIYTYTSQGFDYKDVMKNAPGTYPNCGTYIKNVGVGAVSSSSSFIATWKSSKYTPGINSGGC
jgi:hypothetical protein